MPELALRSVPASAAFRVAAPVRSGDGRLAVSGGTAWPYLAGEHADGRWPEIVSVGRVTDRLAGGGRANHWQAPYRPAVRTACDLAADTDKR